MKSSFGLFKQKLELEGMGDIVISSFQYLYDKLASGETGMLSKAQITKPDQSKIKDYSELPEGKNAPWDQLAVIKLNGGLGTSMGLAKAKSLLEVKSGYSFLDVIALQILDLRKKKGSALPLLFMDSFNTSADTLAALARYKQLPVAELPLDFLQNKFPKVRIKDLAPLENQEDKKNWNPPGHGEIYMVLKQTGVLDLLLKKGFRYVFISNSDNLGAVADARILEYMSQKHLPFIMEVCLRTEMDKKGGHLASDKSGRLILRESAQCPVEESKEFQDVGYYRYFNTNNLWVNLEELSRRLKENEGSLHLNPIMNKKVVDGEEVIQLETAMGAAINVFEKSEAVVVQRNRFVPVKKTNEFLAVRSDAYILDKNWNIVLAGGRKKSPQIDLDESYYKSIGEFEGRFREEYPSLVDCDSLRVKGDISFGKNVKIKGKVKIFAENKGYLENKELIDLELNI